MSPGAGGAALGDALLRLARAALSSELAASSDWRRLHAELSATELGLRLQAPGATFVTLRSGSDLRGCIGSLEATRPLVEDVRANAVAAATRDPRFERVTAGELPGLRIEVSLLGRQSRLEVADEAEAAAVLRPRVDGVVLRFGDHRATFLPQVWHQLPSPRRFLLHLKRKAGLADEFWHADIELSRYGVVKWAERDRR